MEGNKLDSVFSNLAIPYESVRYRPFTDAEDNNLRLVGDAFEPGSSADCYVTPGGSLQKRPVFSTWWFGQTNQIISGKRIDYVWHYTTLPDANGVVYSYELMSVFNLSTTLWEMYFRPTISGVIQIFSNVRFVNNSTQIHRVGFSRGVAYVKALPTAASAEKLGTIIFDGSGGTVVYKFWGMLGPTIPARITGDTNKLTVAATATAATLTVASTTGFDTPTGRLWIDTEVVDYTGTTATTFTGCTRGAAGSKAAEHAVNTRVLQRDWSASAHKVEVNQGWQYTYTWKTVQEGETNRAPLEFNPSLLPSDTLPFFGLRPKVTVQGHTDTTNVTKICIYRTTDGGGDFYFLEEITNTGSGAIVYEDKSLGSGASGTTLEDPLPDIKLDTTRMAPSLTSNSPPPTVNPPSVVGVATPSRNASHIVSFSSRFWYAIDNVVYYSGDEEIKTGIPEESWPSGTFGNFFRFTDRIVALQATSGALYILGITYIYILTGTNKETFSVRKIASHAGMWEQAPEASVSFLDRVAYLADDGRVMLITGDYVDVISEPIIAASRGTGFVQMVFYTRLNVQWLCLLNPARSGGATSTMQVYDWARSTMERRDFWFAPWSGRLNAIWTFEQSGSRVMGAVANDSVGTPNSSGLVAIDVDSFGGDVTDSIILNAAWTTLARVLVVRIQTFKNPPGNHVNSHAVPALTTVLGYCKLDYYSGGVTTNIGLTVFYDNALLTGTAATSRQVSPTRRTASAGYITREWWFWQVGQDFGLTISNGDMADGQSLRLDRITVGMFPGAGPDGPMSEKDAS
jgi:hypothetical protein